MGLSILRVLEQIKAACETNSESFLTFNLDIHYLICLSTHLQAIKEALMDTVRAD